MIQRRVTVLQINKYIFNPQNQQTRDDQENKLVRLLQPLPVGMGKYKTPG